MRIKICGINSPEALTAAAQSGADAVGFVFYERSPRAVTLSAAKDLSAQRPPDLATVALLVDPSDGLVEDVVNQVRPTWLQLHGSETPHRAAEIRARHGVKIMKALGVSSPESLDQIRRYTGAVDQFLFDAKPPSDADLPGGNGNAFDWRLLQDLELTLPWLLAGGLSPANVAHAIAETGAHGVDVSSGVEKAPGVKDPEKIAAFVTAARHALDGPGTSA